MTLERLPENSGSLNTEGDKMIAYDLYWKSNDDMDSLLDRISLSRLRSANL